MFLMNAESTVTTATSSSNCIRTPRTSGASRCKAASMIPERATPALTRSADPTMITISSLNPEKASSSGTTPSAKASRSAQAAHRS